MVVGGGQKGGLFFYIFMVNTYQHYAHIFIFLNKLIVEMKGRCGFIVETKGKVWFYCKNEGKYVVL